jgi:hypothetical protein
MNPRMALQLPSLPDLRQRLGQLRARERALLFMGRHGTAAAGPALALPQQ